MVGLDGVCPGSLVASVSGLICFAELEGPSLESLRHIVHLRVDRIFGLSDGISSVACAGAGVSSSGIAGRFTTTGICGSGTPAGIE